MGTRRVIILLSVFSFNTTIYASSDLYVDNAMKYNEDTFRKNVGKSTLFVKFYAPWCGHCKRLAPTWDELAEKYNTESENQQVVIAKVDCTSETALCSEQGITGYPTLKLFQKGETEGTKYKGPRDIASLEAFITKNLGEEEEIVKVVKPPEPVNNLRDLTDDTFHKAIERGHSFVKFYAPWCGHCQKLAPTWQALANSFQHDLTVKILKIDCTVNRLSCNEFEVKSYPTLIWIVDGKKVEIYQGSRTHEDLKLFVDKMRKQENEIDSGGEDGKIPDNLSKPGGPVAQLVATNFEDSIKNGVTFVKFFAPWCGHCRKLAPVWDELGWKFIEDHNVKIAQVDCSSQESLCSKYKVDGYPTLILFKNGVRITEYKDERELSSLHAFVKRHESHDEL